MWAQIFGVDHLQARLGHLGEHCADVHQLASGENVLLDEFAQPCAKLVIVRRTGGDAVVHDQAARAQQTPNFAEIGL